MKKRNCIAYTLVMVLLMSACSFAVSYAATDKDKLNEVNNKISETHKKLTAGQKKAKALNAEIAKLEGNINAAEKEIANLQGNIGKMKSNIQVAEGNLNEVKKQMNEQNTNLNARLRTMYKNGDVGLVEVLLGSDNITQFMTNMDMVQRIFDNDVAVLESMETQYKKIDAQKKQLEDMNQKLQAQKQTTAQKQDALEASQNEVANKKAAVEKDNKALALMEDNLNKEADALIAKINKLQDKDLIYKGTGQFQWPVPSSQRITSPFGYRMHPVLKVKKMHTGIDIGAKSGVSIVAADDGKVIMAGWNNGYGNVVMIDHGSGLATLYGHNSRLLVSVGDQVTRGQQIAKAGSTGMSTGPHCHFEVRKNGAYVNPQSYLK